MTPRTPLILASASPRRRALMAEAGYDFEVLAPHVDESPADGLPPADAAVEIARRKAEAVASAHPSSVILSADTIVVAPGGKILGKPAGPADARRMLSELSGSTHVVITGVFAIDASSGRRLSKAVSTTVFFGKMTPAEIDAYVDSGEALGKAGAYAIQETGDRFVRRIEGSLTNVVGLPMEAVAQMLSQLGIPPPGPRGAQGG